MKVSLNELLQLNSLKIYNLYEDKLDTFYNTFFYNQICYDDFKKIAINEIDNLKNEITIGSDFFTSLKNRIEITIKKETDLSKDSNFVNYLADIKRYRVLSQEETIDLIREAQNGDKEAKQLLVKHNLKLVLFAIKKFIGFGIDIDDLVQEGSIGLLSAIERFKPEKGTMFSTYAMYYIRNNIYKTIYECRTIKLSSYLMDSIMKYKNIEIELLKELNREPTIEEIALKMNISKEKCHRLYLLQNEIVSLNKSVDDDSQEAELVDFIASDCNVEDIAINNFLVNDLKKAIDNSNLTDKEKYVLIHRYELFDYKKMTLDELGKSLNLTKEAIRKIESSALEKLKRSFDVGKLFYYLHDNIDSSNGNIDLFKEYNEIKTKIDSEYFNYLFECELSPMEMLILCLSLGLIDNKVYSNREIAEKINKSYQFVNKLLSNAVSKLKNDENKEKIFNHANSLIQENKSLKKSKPKRSIYDVIGCTEEELQEVVKILSEDDLKLLNKRKSSTYQLTMTKEEKENFKLLLKKIRNLLKGSNNKSQEIVIELNDIKNNLENFKENRDSELYSIIEKIINTKIFKELNKQFSVKETVAIMLLNGYIYDSVYSADYVSKLLNIDIKRIYEIFKKSFIVVKYLSFNDIEEVKELTKN